MRYLAVLLLFTLLIRTDVSISKNHETKTYLRMNFCVTQESYLDIKYFKYKKRFKNGFMYPIIEGAKCNSVYNFKLYTVKQYGVNYLNQMYSSFLKQYRLDKKFTSSGFCMLDNLNYVYENYKIAERAHSVQIFFKTFERGCDISSLKSEEYEIFSDAVGYYYYKKNINTHQNQTVKKPSRPTNPPRANNPRETVSETSNKLIPIGAGTGFFISNRGHIVSNNHVVGVCRKVVTKINGKKYDLDILATDKVNDLGIVKANFRPSTYLPIKSDGANLGEDIVAFGFPLAGKLSDSVKITKGIVSSLSGPENNYSQIQIDAALQPGNSGGPVLNMNGEVVGVASAGLSKLYMVKTAKYIPENVNFAVSANTLANFLKANKISYTDENFVSKNYSTSELAKIGEPVTLQLHCMNTRAVYEKLKSQKEYSTMLLDIK